MSLEPSTTTGAAGSHDPTLDRYVVEHLDEALEQGRICAYYQPVVRTLTGKLCGLEALARWNDPKHGLLEPKSFIPALEEAKVIHKLDSHIIHLVCMQYRQCVEAGTPTVPISFNLSRVDFDLCDMFNVVEESVREFEVPRNMLNIEITETVFGTDPMYMSMMVRKFHDVGYQVWMDDFGAGYSTLNALKDFDFDELKIDMAFLNRFGDKSKTILASVVDMAKKLGIQTLAEGVETEEHRTYLRNIGCEKMQGFLYGKPLPFSPAKGMELIRSLGVESPSERQYFIAIGAVNTLSLSERDLTANSLTQDYVTSMPFAIAEFSDDTFRVIHSNRVFREGLANVGIDSIEMAEQMINNPSRILARTSRRMIETIAENKYARLDYVVGDTACVMRAKHITTQNGKTALLISIDDTIEQSERKRRDRMDEALNVLYSIYEHIDIIHLDEGFIEPVFSNAGWQSHYNVPEFENVGKRFAETEVFESDRKRYMEFMDHDTMIDRIRESGENYLASFFRVRAHGGDHAWKLFGLIRLTERPGNQVMLCIRNTHWSNDALLQEAFDGHADSGGHDFGRSDMHLTDGSLWRAISRDETMGFFWKDRDRRFIAANQTFLDYYGFESVDEIRGKTDEDMGWHVDPVPYMEDELRVLNEGYCTHDVVGQCISHGEIRAIMASKRPVYRNGRIVGLVGYFIDIAEKWRPSDEMSMMPLIDPVTDTLNYTGLAASLSRYVDSYMKLGTDFGIIYIDIDSFKMINDEFGYAFGDKVLRRVADEVQDVVGSNCVIGHIYADQFVILAQDADNDKLQAICDEIERRLMAIAHIDGTPCTVYAFSGFARYSEAEDTEEAKLLGHTRLLERKLRERRQDDDSKND